MKNEIDRDAPLTAMEKIAAASLLFWPLITLLAIGTLCGCATKTRNVEIDGMYAQVETATVAIGSVDVMAAPVGEESAIIKYDEDTGWLSPSTKLHSIKIQLTGTNCTSCVTDIVSSVCRAFVPSMAIATGLDRGNNQAKTNSVGKVVR